MSTVLDAVANNARGTLASTLTSGAGTVILTTGDGQLFPSSGKFNIIVWNYTDYPNPVDAYRAKILSSIAGAYEIIRITSRSTDTLTVDTSGRGQEGTSAENFTTGGKIYRVMLAETKYVRDTLNTAVNAAESHLPIGTAAMANAAKASLPSAGTVGRVYRVTDKQRGMWMDTGTQWSPVGQFVVNAADFDVKADNVADDTAALNNAINALPPEGGVVILPPGIIRHTGLVIGDGAYDGSITTGKRWSTKHHIVFMGQGSGSASGLGDLRASGTNTSTNTSKLIDSGAIFNNVNIKVGDSVKNVTDSTTATVVSIDSATQLTLSADIFTATSKSYEVRDAILGATTLKYVGATSGKVIEYKGIIRACGLLNLRIDCGGSASTTGLYMLGLQNSVIDNVVVMNVGVNGVGMIWDHANNGNVVTNLDIVAQANGASAWKIGINGIVGSQRSGNSQNVIKRCTLYFASDVSTSYGLYIKNLDNNIFEQVHSLNNSGNTSGYGLYFDRVASPDWVFPHENQFINCAFENKTGGISVGGIAGHGGTLFLGFPTSDGESLPSIPGIYGLAYQNTPGRALLFGRWDVGSFSFNATGTAAITNGQATVDGTSSSYTLEVLRDDAITISGTTKYVKSVDSSTQITADSNWSSALSSQVATIYPVPMRIVGKGVNQRLFSIENNANADMMVQSFGTSARSGLLMRAARGTNASPTASQNNDFIGVVGGGGYGSTGFSGFKAYIAFIAGEAISDSAQGHYIAIYTTAAGGTTTTEKIRINASGNVGIGTTSDTNKVSITAALNSAMAINAQNTVDSSAGATMRGAYIGVQDSSTGAQANGSTTVTAGFFQAECKTSSGNSHAGNFRGIQGQFLMQDAGTVALARGIDFTIGNQSTGTITNGTGAYVLVINNSTGTITTAYGLYVKINKGSGTITTAYGIYIDSAAMGTTAYSIYSANTADSYLAGGLAIGGGATLKKILTATATLDFSAAAGSTHDLTVSVTGAAVGDCVNLGLPTGGIPGTGDEATYMAWVSAADTVTVRLCNPTVSTVNPASATFRVVVLQF